MGKYNYMNLNQKMIRIRKKVPKLIRKRYSEDVTYDFVKLDDIYECLTPALNKYGVDFDILSERPTQVDEQGNSVFLKEMGALWRYEADLELCWTNADRPGDKVRSFLHVIGTNEAPDKAKGAAWTYGLKYYFLNKFGINSFRHLRQVSHSWAVPCDLYEATRIFMPCRASISCAVPIFSSVPQPRNK